MQMTSNATGVRSDTGAVAAPISALSIESPRCAQDDPLAVQTPPLIAQLLGRLPHRELYVEKVPGDIAEIVLRILRTVPLPPRPRAPFG